MQNNSKYIFKLIVALTFLMCIVCSHYQDSFLMFYIVLIFTFSFFFFVFFLFFFFCFIFLNERQQKGRKKKETNKENKKS